MVSHQGDKEQGKGYKSDSPYRRGAFPRHLFDADDFGAQLLEDHCNIFGRGVIGQLLDKSFCRFVSFGLKYCDVFRVLLERQLAEFPGIRDKYLK
jgi:hypothetical protein